MVNKKHRNTVGDVPLDRSSQMSVPHRHQHRLNHDYAEADILRLSAFFRSNPNPILVCSPDGEVIKVNPAAERLLRRLHLTETDLLPANHCQIVTACLEGSLREYGVEVATDRHTFALTYHPMPAFKLVYVYAIDITAYKLAEADLLQIATRTLTLAQQAVSHLQSFRQTRQQSGVKPTPTSQAQDFFVAMDGCAFGGDIDRAGL
jgi:hypothetical protein